MTKRIILITGCSSGIGFDTTLKFARRGDIVFASMRNIASEGGRELQEIAREEALDITVLEIDVTKEKTIETAMIQIRQAGKIDVLVNNAGFGFVGPVEAFSIEELQEQYATSVFGTMRMIKAITPIMREQKSGLIINISSIHGLLAFPLWGVYASSKFALEALSESLRFELRPFGIKVTLVEPGSFLTNFTTNRKQPKSLQDENSIYRKSTFGFFNKFDEMGKKAKKGKLAKLINPERVADIIYKISQQKNPRLHNRVGIDSHIYYHAKKLLPNFLWENLLKKVYN